MKKRLLSILLALCMALALLPVGAFAADSDFDIENGVLTEYKGPGGNVVIPNSVTVIGEDAFFECTGLTSVSIPNSVTEIGGWAFAYCTSLTSVSIPDSVTEIGEGAFWGCDSLTSVSIPNSVTEIGGWAFFDCSSLTSVSIPNSVTKIGGSAFKDTPWLEGQGEFPVVNGILLGYQGNNSSVSIPNSVTEIGGRAFEGCTSLTSVSIPNSVTEIGGRAFFDCSSLTSVTIPASVKAIGAHAFDLLGEIWGPNVYQEFYISAFYLKDIYYGGTKAQWNAISIDDENETLKTATIHFNSTGPAAPAFTDVPDWCAAPVDWAVDKGITNGTGDNKFSPHDLCKHAEILTFLWRAAGRPASGAALPVDITGKNVDWAADALRWAAEKGMIDGGVDPAARCTRAEAVVYIWKALGSAAAAGTTFPDVPANAAYAKAVAWAVANGVTNGYEDGTFGPNKTCSRGEIVTFLYRAMG